MVFGNQYIAINRCVDVAITGWRVHNLQDELDEGGVQVVANLLVALLLGDEVV